MLDTRYVHLHEALGLGALWLHKTAKVLPPVSAPETAAKTTPPPLQKQPAPPVRDNAPPIRHAHPQPEPQPETAAQPASQPAERSNISWAEPPRPARVLVLSVCASLEDRMRQKLFSGEDGELLHKMLAAIQLLPQDVHCSTWLKQSAHFNPNPSEEEVQAAWADVYQEWQQCGRPPLWLLGDFFEREDVRRCLQQCAPTPYFVTSHPLRLLKYPQLKRAAWDTLQQLKAELDRTNAK